MKRAISYILFVVFLFFSCSTSAVNAAAADFTLEYNLYLEKEDFPRVELKVTGLRESSPEFYFASTSGGIFNVLSDLTSFFTDISVHTSDGVSLKWSWKEKNSVVVENPGQKDFTVSYVINAMKIARGGGMGVNATFTGEKFMLFRNYSIFFSPAETLLIPHTEPLKLTLKSHLPAGVQLYSSLPQTGGVFVAQRNLWGNLLTDFAKLYFYGGKTALKEEYIGVTGNTYRYVLFETPVEPRDYNSWFPSYGSQKDAAQKYMRVIDMFSQYYSDYIAPLPAHGVLITDTVSRGSQLKVSDRGNWLDRMQLWPEDAMLEQVAHHVFHNYSFNGWTAKLGFSNDHFLSEGLPTYFEHTVPALLLGDDFFTGRLYGLYALDTRGEHFNIRSSEFHTRYNVSTLKVYLLDKAIQKATNGDKDITDFASRLYALSENADRPRNVQDEQIESIFGSLAGSENANLYKEIRDAQTFDDSDFSSLLDEFKSYVDDISKQYFWSSRLIFLCYLDISAAKGNEMPHYAVAEQEMPFSRSDSFNGFRNYLFSLKKSKLTEKDITDAMSSVTGKDHSGFFEYWRAKGISLNPNDVPALKTWQPGKDYKSQTQNIPTMASLTWNIPVKIAVDGKPLTMDVSPTVINGRLLVPLRAITEALGAQVAWSEETKTVTITHGDKTVVLVVNDKTALINGKEYTLDVPPSVVNNRTMVPLRFISEFAGCTVHWYDPVKTVLIETVESAN